MLAWDLKLQCQTTNLVMKTFKHIAIITSAVTATVALCSAGYYISTEEKFRTNYTNFISFKRVAY